MVGGGAAAVPDLAARRGRWLVWGVMSTALFVSFFHRVAPAVVADRLMAEFDIGAAAVGGLASIYFYVYMAMQIPTGILADTVGPRKTAAAGSLLAAAGALLFALAPGLPAAFAGRFLVGLGVAVAFICVLKIQTSWFRPTEFATLSGLLSVVTTSAAALAATPLAAAADAFGWRPAFGASAMASIAVAALVWWLARDRPPGGVAHAEAAGHPPAAFTIREAAPLVWRNRQTWLCFTAHFGWFGGYLAFTGLWGVPYLMHVYGFDRLTSANLMIGAAVAYTAGALVLGVVSDRWLRRRKPPMLAAGVIFLGLWLALVLWPGGRPPAAVAVVAFTLAGAAAAANLLCFALSKESNPPAAAGLAMASTNGGILCAALLQPAMGYVLDLGWQGELLAGARVYPAASYQMAFVGFVAVGALALLAAALVRESHVRSIYDRPELRAQGGLATPPGA